MPAEIRPISRRLAREYVSLHHRHNSMPPGWIVGVALQDGNELVGFGCLGRPSSRMLQDGTTAEITRVTTEGYPNACSQIYGALCRAAKALGYKRVVTYTLATEQGTSLKAAGFERDGETADQTWSRPSRPRELVAPQGVKVRWVRHYS